MANATPADARAGFEIFKTSNGQASLDEINQQLAQAGYGPIKDRTFRHYRSLLNAGYDRYISVNRFDVARSSRPYENASSNGRYRYLPAHVGVRMTLARDGDLVEVLGIANRVGEVGAQLLFEDSEVAAALEKAKLHATQMVRLDFLDPPRSTSARVIEVEFLDDRAAVEVEFARLQSVIEYTGQEPLEAQRFEFRLIPTTDDGQAADLVGRRIYFFLELLEASRAVVNEFLHSADSESYATPAVIERLRIESPAEFLMLVPTPVATVVGSVVPMIAVYRMAQGARLKKAEADAKVEDARAKRIANDVAEATADTQKAIHEVLQREFAAGSPEPSQRLNQLMERELFRATESLASQDIAEVETRSVPDEAV